MSIPTFDASKVLSEATAKTLRDIIRARGEAWVCAELRLAAGTLARCAACMSVQRATMSKVSTWTRGQAPVSAWLAPKPPPPE